MDKKMKLETEVEKQTHKLVMQIKEHVRDFTFLYVRRNNVDVDRESMSRVLDVVDLAVQDGYHKNIDKFGHALDKTLSDFSGEEENPTE